MPFNGVTEIYDTISNTLKKCKYNKIDKPIGE